MNFLKYPSLTNHYVLGKSRRILYTYNDLWYSTEKIHGDNISIVVSKDTAEVGQSLCLLSEGSGVRFPQEWFK